MARVTIEDCTLKIPSRFELVVLAAQRAKEIAAGAKPSIDRDNDKNPVIALREIACENLTLEGLKESFIKKLMRKQVSSDQDVPEDITFSEEIANEMKQLENDTSEDDLESMYHDEEDTTGEV
jgi:DNA-directed RNA polymerase subunit omega